MALSANPPCMERWQTLGRIFSLIVETRLQGLGRVLNYGCCCMKKLKLGELVHLCVLVHACMCASRQVVKHKCVACKVQLHISIYLKGEVLQEATICHHLPECKMFRSNK